MLRFVKCMGFDKTIGVVSICIISYLCVFAAGLSLVKAMAAMVIIQHVPAWQQANFNRRPRYAIDLWLP